jgi:hypothetical protein
LLSTIIYVLILTKINQLAVINGIVSMKDEKEYLKPNININGGYFLIFVTIVM